MAEVRDLLLQLLELMERQKHDAILPDIHQLFDEDEAPEWEDEFPEWIDGCENFVQQELDENGSIMFNQNDDGSDAHEVFDKIPNSQLITNLVRVHVGNVYEDSVRNDSFKMVVIGPIWPTGVGTKHCTRDFSNFYGYDECAYKVFDKLSKRNHNIKFEVLSQILPYLNSFSGCPWFQFHLCTKNVVVWYYQRVTWPTGIGTILRKFRLLACGKFLLRGKDNEAILMRAEFFTIFAQSLSDLDGRNSVFTAELCSWNWFMGSKCSRDVKIEVVNQEDEVTVIMNERFSLWETSDFGVVNTFGVYMKVSKIQ